MNNLPLHFLISITICLTSLSVSAALLQQQDATPQHMTMATNAAIKSLHQQSDEQQTLINQSQQSAPDAAAPVLAGALPPAPVQQAVAPLDQGLQAGDVDEKAKKEREADRVAKEKAASAVAKAMADRQQRESLASSDTEAADGSGTTRLIIDNDDQAPDKEDKDAAELVELRATVTAEIRAEAARIGSAGLHGIINVLTADVNAEAFDAVLKTVKALAEEFNTKRNEQWGLTRWWNRDSDLIAAQNAAAVVIKNKLEQLAVPAAIPAGAVPAAPAPGIGMAAMRARAARRAAAVVADDAAGAPGRARAALAAHVAMAAVAPGVPGAGAAGLPPAPVVIIPIGAPGIAPIWGLPDPNSQQVIAGTIMFNAALEQIRRHTPEKGSRVLDAIHYLRNKITATKQFVQAQAQAVRDKIRGVWGHGRLGKIGVCTGAIITTGITIRYAGTMIKCIKSGITKHKNASIVAAVIALLAGVVDQY